VDNAHFVQVRADSMDEWVTQAIATSWECTARAIDRDWARVRLGNDRPAQYRVITEAHLLMEGGSAAVARAVASLEHEAYRAARWLEAPALDSESPPARSAQG
jgi:hypothetical protein